MSDLCCPPQLISCPDAKNRVAPGDPPESRRDLPTSIVGEVMSPIGPVPRVSNQLSQYDRLGMWKVRWGIGRMGYTVAPGLYALGQPDEGSEVLVTANYKMTFDLLRRCLTNVDVWILVLDTRGVNVWCAAGKGTFGTDELARCVEAAGVNAVVRHRRLIVPQLGAPGIAAHEVRKRTGFSVLYGPVEMRDIPAYLEKGRQATPAMRRKDFPVTERAVLVPMELVPALKWVVMGTGAMALLAGILGRGPFVANALLHGSRAFLFMALGTFAGAVATPILLPWVPGRSFALKGAITGLTVALILFGGGFLRGLDGLAWLLLITAASSFLAMNFTGSSTFTSLSGVKREMKIAVPAQAVLSLAAIGLWMYALLIPGGVS